MSKAVIMECTSKVKHPNADSLFVYGFSISNYTVPIVANLENIYDIGDKAIIALEYAVLKDGTKIRVSKLRGIRSYGMALGKSVLPIGTDVSDKYCQSQTVVNGFTFKSWPDIGQLFNVRKDMTDGNTLRKVAYRPKIKLDGTNASVRVSADGRIAAQSRERLLTVGDDNFGFAAWVELNRSYFNPISNQDIIIHGEWCGSGIGGGAIRNIKKKIFAVFAIQLENPAGDTIVYEPNLIGRYIAKQDDLYIIPWADEMVVLNYDDKTILAVQAEVINKVVLDIDKCDPWVKKTFTQEGSGEGLVMYPIFDDTGMINRDDFSELLFKAKAESHRVVKTKSAVEIDPLVAKSIEEFVGLFTTEARFNQILVAVGGDLHQKYTGEFVKRFTLDVKKESVAELDASGLEWTQVAKEVSRAASQWWSKKCQEI